MTNIVDLHKGADRVEIWHGRKKEENGALTPCWCVDVWLDGGRLFDEVYPSRDDAFHAAKSWETPIIFVDQPSEAA